MTTEYHLKNNLNYYKNKMKQKYKVQFFQDDTYEVLELEDSLDDSYQSQFQTTDASFPTQEYVKVFQGSLSDCEAFIRLREKDYM